MTWAQDVGGAKRLRVTATRGCFAAGRRRRQRSQEAVGCHTRLAETRNSGSRAGRQPRKRRGGATRPLRSGETERLQEPHGPGRRRQT